MTEQVSWSSAASGPGLIELAGSVRVDLHTCGLPGPNRLAILAALRPIKGERAAVREARKRGYVVCLSELEEGAYGVSAGVAMPHAPAEASGGIISLRPLDDEVVGADVRAAADAITDVLSVSLPRAANQSRRQDERRDCE
jgi:hypothetical protein